MEFAQKSHVAIVGLGGVGSWAAEALARTGISEITLIDFDDVCVSNINRQIQALNSTVGYAKVQVIKNRLTDINPDIKVNLIQDFFSAENKDQCFQLGFNYVIDAIDSINAKSLLVSECVKRGVFIVTCGAAGGKMDSDKIKVSDLSLTEYDPLLSKMRRVLRQDYGFPKLKGKKFNVSAIYSSEISVTPEVCEQPTSGRLDCQTGYGSLVHITAVFGFKAAEIIICQIKKNSENLQ